MYDDMMIDDVKHMGKLKILGGTGGLRWDRCWVC